MASFKTVKRRGSTSFNNAFYLVIVSKILFQHVMNIKIINELFNILCTRPWESDVCFTCTALPCAGQPHCRCSVVTCGGGSCNIEASEIFLVLPATGSKAVLLEGSELGALDLSFPRCEVRVVLHVLLILRGDFMVSQSQELLF